MNPWPGLIPDTMQDSADLVPWPYQQVRCPLCNFVGNNENDLEQHIEEDCKEYRDAGATQTPGGLGVL